MQRWGVWGGTPRVRSVGLLAVAALSILVPALPAVAVADPPVFNTTWGTYGSGNGQFDYPQAVAVDGDGNVYVADTYNYRVQKFTAAGTYVAQWGAPGSGNGQLFSRPSGVAVDGNGNVYVADTGNNQIQKFTAAGAYVTRWGTTGSGNGQFDLPEGVAVDGNGNVYVADTYNNRIQKFTAAGTYVAQWGTLGSGDVQFDGPQGVAVDGDGNVYVADTFNNRIQKFTAAGMYVTQWGTYGSDDGEFEHPEELAVDGNGNVYVADTYNNRIQKFTASGTYLTRWGTYGIGEGDFEDPEGVAVDGNGNVYVADTYNNRIQKFTPVSAGPVGIAGTVREVGTLAAIQNAWVLIMRTSNLSVAAGAVTNASGTYNATVPPGTYFVYLVDPEGNHTAGFFGPPTTVTVTSGNTTTINPLLPSTRGRISGTITETGSGTPITGALGITLTSGGVFERGVVASGSGQYEIAGLTAGNHFVGFLDPTGNHASRFFPNSPVVPSATTVSVTSGASTTANGSLPTQAGSGTGSILSGTVRQTGTGTALSGMWVIALKAADYRMARVVTTNMSGGYSMSLGAGSYKIAFIDPTGRHAQEWHNNQPSSGLANATTVTVPATVNAQLDRTTGSITGAVTADPGPAALGGIWVLAIGPSGPTGSAVTAANGTYTISDLPAGTYRLAFVDPAGSRATEYYNNSPTFDGSTAFAVLAGSSTTKNAALPLA